jgi:hypothetical protein
LASRTNGKRKRGYDNCASSCVEGGHPSWGACVRAKRLNLNPNLAGRSAQKAWDRELDSYESAVRQGVQPDSTRQDAIDRAMRESDRSGIAYGN